MSTNPICFNCGSANNDLHFADIGHGPVYMHDNLEDCVEALRGDNELLASNLKHAERYIDALLADLANTEAS